MHVQQGRLGFTPYQTPHPPLEMGAQSEGATPRAARLTDGVFFGPQLGWRDVARFASVFRDERAAAGAGHAGQSSAPRAASSSGSSKEAAATAARAYLEKTFNMYRTWRHAGADHGARCSWASTRAWRTGRSTARPRTAWRPSSGRARSGVERIGFSIYSLPAESARASTTCR